MQNVKTNLEQLLKERNKTMYALAKEENISYSTIHKIVKKDLQSIDLGILQKICRNLKCTPNDLLEVGGVNE